MSHLRQAWGGFFFAALCGVQFWLMARYALTEVVPAVPLANDQVTYLFDTYLAALTGQTAGGAAGLVQVLRGAPAAGCGLQLLAYGVMLVHGIGRMSALAVNFAYFALVPLGLYLILGRSRRLALALFATGFWLSVQSMYGLVGSPFDFRLDFAGMALFALVCALLWRTEAFTRPGVCVLTALAIVWLCVTRSIMAAHLAVMGVILLAGLVAMRETRQSRATWIGVALTAAVAAAGIVPYLVVQWDRIWGYYVVGHVIGPEKDVRARMAGIGDGLDALAYYPRELFAKQLGLEAERLLVITLAAAAVALISAAVRRHRRHRSVAPPRPAAPRPTSAAWAALVVAAATLGPYVTLTMDVQKSWVVANVFVVSVGGIAVLAFAAVAGELSWRLGRRWGNRAAVALGLLGLAYGLNYERIALAQPSVITQHREDFAARDRMLTLITEVSAANHWREPLLFVDHIGDLDGLQMRLSHFERYGDDLPVGRLLAQIFEVEPPELWRSLTRADFLIIRDPTATPSGNYPFDWQMVRLNGELHEFCRSRCRKLATEVYFGVPLVLYSRIEGGP